MALHWSLEWQQPVVRQFNPNWDLKDVIIAKYYHTGTRRHEEWIYFKQNLNLPRERAREVGFLRRTKGKLGPVYLLYCFDFFCMCFFMFLQQTYHDISIFHTFSIFFLQSQGSPSLWHLRDMGHQHQPKCGHRSHHRMGMRRRTGGEQTLRRLRLPGQRNLDEFGQVQCFTQKMHNHNTDQTVEFKIYFGIWYRLNPLNPFDWGHLQDPRRVATIQTPPHPGPVCPTSRSCASAHGHAGGGRWRMVRGLRWSEPSLIGRAFLEHCLPKLKL